MEVTFSSASTATTFFPHHPLPYSFGLAFCVVDIPHFAFASVVCLWMGPRWTNIDERRGYHVRIDPGSCTSRIAEHDRLRRSGGLQLRPSQRRSVHSCWQIDDRCCARNIEVLDEVYEISSNLAGVGTYSYKRPRSSAMLRPSRSSYTACTRLSS